MRTAIYTFCLLSVLFSRVLLAQVSPNQVLRVEFDFSDGPQGWSFSISHDAELSLADATVNGLSVNTKRTFDDDDNPETPRQVFDPEAFDLADADFKQSSPATRALDFASATADGAVSAVVMAVSDQTSRTLQPNTTQTAILTQPSGSSYQMAPARARTIHAAKTRTGIAAALITR